MPRHSHNHPPPTDSGASREFGVYPARECPAGIYVHIPFCFSKCPYCGFVSYPFEKRAVEAYGETLLEEIRLQGNVVRETPHLKGIGADTVYIGGGTPTSMGTEFLRVVIERCRAEFELPVDSEITVEVNPGDVTQEDLRDLRAAGTTRLSIGVQSAAVGDLRYLGRRHSAESGPATIAHAGNAGFEDISVDLIAGLPGQSVESLEMSVQRILEYRPEHLSAYLLEIKPGTVFASDIAAGRIPEPDDDLAAEHYELIRKVLSDAGYEHYEISNFALPGRRARHNLKYWNDGIFVGIGAGAHGMTGRVRYENLCGLDAYNAAIKQGVLPVGESVQLSPLARFKDALIMMGRLIEGIDLRSLGNRYGIDAAAYVRETVSDLGDAGLCRVDDDRFALTERGLLLSNIVFSRWL